ncbi:MAG: hypothetical protein K9W44_10635 [Candidatus Lokiarchaeota archaeon]|nr:hypothetical protein [Candidatus Harpocratesius repetitus]
MSSQMVKLNSNMNNFLQKATQELKILFILYHHDKIRHSEIQHFNEKYPGVNRKSSRTYYKIYQRLISFGLIQKVKDIVSNRQYYAYTITQQGREYLDFLFKLPKNQKMISYQDYQNSLNIHKLKNSKNLNSILQINQIRLDKAQNNIGNTSNSQNDHIISYLIEEIKSLKSQLKNINHFQTIPSQISHESSKSNLNDEHGDYGDYDDSGDSRDYETYNNANSVESSILENPQGKILYNNNGNNQETTLKSSSVSHLSSNVISNSISIPNKDIYENKNNELNSSQQQNSVMQESPKKEPVTEIPKEPPFLTHLKSITQEEILEEIVSIFEDSAKWGLFLQYFQELEYKSEFNLAIFNRLYNHFKEKPDLNRVKTNLVQIISELDFTFNELNEIFIKYPSPVIVQIFTEHLLTNYSVAEWENINVSYGNGKTSIINFLHYIARYYFIQKRYQACWDLIQEIRRKYTRIGEIAFQYEISILIRQLEFDQAIQLIKTELFDRERQVAEKKTWYYIFRAFYDAKRLPEFLNLQYNRDKREIYYQWAKLVELIFQIKKGPEFMPNFFIIKKTLETFLPIFEKIDIMNLIPQYLIEMKKYQKTKETNQIYYYYFHLAPIIYLIFQNPLILGLSADSDYKIEEILNICLQNDIRDIFDDFPSVLQEIKELLGLIH